MVEWEKSFYGEDRDNTIKTIRKDPGELSGIFNKISSIAKELLQSHSLKFESTVEDAKIKWLERSDSTHKFLDKMAVRGPDYYIPIPVLWCNYNQFCKEHGMTPLNDRGFNRKLEQLGLSRTQKKVNKMNMKVWLGVTLRSELTKDNQSLN